MSRSDPGDPRSGADPSSAAPPGGPERPASWMGAPGYTPPRELPAHAPMPGAPPYPERPVEPMAVGRPRTGTSFLRVLAAGAVWAALHAVLVWLLPGAVSPVRFGAGLATCTVLVALAGWAWARRRAWPFWLLVLAVAPLFWVLRALVAVPLG